MTVVITGGRGYIGQHVAAALAAAGTPTRVLGRAQTPGTYLDQTGAEATLEDHLTGASAVVHLAGKLVHDREAALEDYLPANVDLTKAVADAAVAAGVGCVVHASSRLVYPATLTAPAIEDRDAAPDTPYGHSKLLAEQALSGAVEGSTTSALSLRIAQVTGGDHPGLGVVNRWIREARSQGTVTVLGEGVAVRELVHVDDVARALITAASYRGEWHPVNVGGTEPVTIAALGSEVARVAGVQVTHAPVESEDRSSFALDHTRANEMLRYEARVSWQAIIAEAWDASGEVGS